MTSPAGTKSPAELGAALAATWEPITDTQVIEAARILLAKDPS